MEISQSKKLFLNCIYFISFKDWLDEHKYRKDHIPYSKLLLSKMTGIKYNFFYSSQLSELNSICPSFYVRYALPFSDPFYDFKNMHQETVNPFLIIGGNYRYKESKTKEEEMHILNFSNSLVTNNKLSDPELPRFAKIGDFPIYVAMEGKNRIELFKSHGKDMLAFVTKNHYPKANDLSLHRISFFWIYALKHKEKLEAIPFGSVTVPLLLSYGVKEGKRINGISVTFHLLNQWIKKRSAITFSQMCR